MDAKVIKLAVMGSEAAGTPVKLGESLWLPDRRGACLAELNIHGTLPEALRQNAW